MAAIDPLLIPIVVPTAFAFSIAAAAILRGPFGQALAKRMGGGSIDHDTQEETEALHADVDGLRERLSEVEERLDFTERMLAQQPRKEALPPEG